MDALWIGLIATSVIAFLLKYVGHSVPEKWLSHPRVLKINGLIPIALLSALVAVQTFLPARETSLWTAALKGFTGPEQSISEHLAEVQLVGQFQ